MLRNQKKHGKKYKTIKKIEKSSAKTNNKTFDSYSQKDLNDEKLQSYKIRNRTNIRMISFNRSFNIFAESNKTRKFQSTMKTNDLSNCITFRMNEMNNLYDTIENIELQLKKLRVLVEGIIKESEDLIKEFCYSEKDLEKDLKSLHINHC
ncbi:hypothetical protein F8M41_015430 [Gigaspora margarita]|uniref:Uncharacterized protein n=1 Tax=Gigaspora margarita TaxID=4874 RepID=A0A8H3ZWD6_GIGMA|nr:hypothetical protein F8M41_015430 [Gigaspora margarita]